MNTSTRIAILSTLISNRPSLITSKLSSDPYSPSRQLLDYTRGHEGSVIHDNLHRVYDDGDSLDDPNRFWKGDIPYQDWAKTLNGNPTIGYGTRFDLLDPDTQAFIQSRKGINDLLAQHYHKRHLIKQEPALRKTYSQHWNTLNDNQRDALRGFHYNVGENARPKSILDALKRNRPDLVPDGMKQWNRANGKVSPGLVNRRKMEVDWYNRPVEQAPSPKPIPPTPVKSLKQRLAEAPIKSFP